MSYNYTMVTTPQQPPEEDWYSPESPPEAPHTEAEDTLVIEVHPWAKFMQAWAQKQLSLLASAKTIITSVIIYLGYTMVTTQYTGQVILNDAVVDITNPYLTGAEWSGMMRDVLVAYLAVRVLQPTIKTVGSVWNKISNRHK